MPDKTLTFVLTARNLASKEFQKVQRELKGVQGDADKARGGFGGMMDAVRSSGVAMIGLGLAAGALGSQLDDAVRAAVAEEQSIAKLDAALKANVPAWDGNREAIEKVLSARMRLGFSDDEQRDSLALLVGATHDVTEALALQRTAMDLARFKGISLKDASEALIRVEGGQFRILKSLIGSTKDITNETEALAAVQRVATGAAEAQANTAGGKLLKAQIAWGESLEKIGGVILPVLVNGITVLTAALDLLSGKLPQTIEDAEDLADSLLDIALTVTGPLKDPLKDFIQTTLGIGEAMEVTGDRSTDALEKLKGEAVWLTQTMSDEVKADTDVIVEDIRGLPGDMGEALLQGKETWRTSWDAYMKESTDSVTAAGDLLEIEAKLQALAMSKNMESADPYTRASSIKAYNDLIAQRKAIYDAMYATGAGAAKQYVSGWNSNRPTLNTVQGMNTVGMHAMATGGHLAVGEWAVVGEGGKPEIIKATPSGTEVMPLGGSAASRGAGSAAAVHNIRVFLQGRELTAYVEEEQAFASAGSPR